MFPSRLGGVIPRKAFSVAIVCCVLMVLWSPVTRALIAQTPSASGWAFKCPDGSLPDSNGSCGRSTGGGGVRDDRAAREREERERAESEAYHRRRRAQIDSAYADSVRRATSRAERLRLAAAERRRRFELEKARGIAELRTDLGDAQLKDAVAGGDEIRLDGGSIGGTMTPQVRRVYGRAFCGLTLLQKAAEKARVDGFGDEESKFLRAQAGMVFDGSDKLEVSCPPVPEVSLPANTDMTRMIAAEKRVLRRMDELGTRSLPPKSGPLSADDQRIQEVFRKQKENESRIADKLAPIISETRRNDEIQERKYDPNDAVKIRREQEAKDKLKGSVDDATESLRKGDIHKAILDLSLSFGNAPASTTKTTKKAK